MTKTFTTVALAAVAATTVSTGVATAQAAAAPAPRAYKNCAALTRVYPHGVARPGGRDLAGGKAKRHPARGFRVDAKLYQLNARLDADHDGVACER